MTMTYTDPGSNDKDAIRFLLQDTNPTEFFLSDEEITYATTKLMPLYGSVEYVAAALAETIAAKYAREATYSADGVSIGLGQVAGQFRELAVSLRAQHKGLLVGGVPDVGGVSLYEELPYDIKPFNFGTGMHDDLAAGNQEYGGRGWNAQGYYVAEEMPGV